LSTANEKLSEEIEERKRTEEALRKSEKRFRAIVEDQTELICRFRPDGTLTFVNDAYCRYFEKAEDDLLGRSFIPLIPEEDHEKVDRHLASLCPENPLASHEHRVIAPNGDIRWHSWTNRMILDAGGNPIEVQSVGRDITDRKKAEEALKDSSERIKMFAYSVSHDLKNPAIAMHGLTQLLHKHYGHMLDDKGRSYCSQIIKASKQMVGLAEQVNVYVATKEAPLRLEKTSLTEILRTVRKDFFEQLDTRRIDWSEPEDLPEITADRMSILRVIRNLVDNALKYGGDELSEITIGYRASNQYHVLSLADNGVGLKEQDSERVFGPFTRIETSGGIEGSGLGLAIVREIAERHAGEVWVEPGRKKGIVFHVSVSKHLKAAF
jgi:PAS domain S-box-containing protein